MLKYLWLVGFLSTSGALSPRCTAVPDRVTTCRASVDALCFSGLGEAVASATDNQTVLLWESVAVDKPIVGRSDQMVVHIVGCSEGVGISCLTSSGNARAFRLGMRGNHSNGMAQIILEDFEVHSCRDHAVKLRADSVELHGMTLDNLRPDLDHGLHFRTQSEERSAVSITSNSRTVISNCTFSNNGMLSQDKGLSGLGALYHQRDNGDLGVEHGNAGYQLLENTVFVNNSGARGGALTLDNDDWTLRNVSFINNTAAYGGAISSHSRLNIIDCLFSSNKAMGRFVDAGANVYYGEGGGISSDQDMIIRKTKFMHNTASSGGAIFAGEGLVEIDNCTFGHNIAETDDGGGICFANAYAVISNTTFDQNFAMRRGGAVRHQMATALVIGASTFTQNSAVENGGAIHTRSSLTITSTHMEHNICVGGRLLINNATSIDWQKTNSECRGGGIYSGQNITVTDSTIVSNVAHGLGGGLYAEDVINITSSDFTSNEATCGGALYTALLHAKGCKFDSNGAKKDGAGVYIRNYGIRTSTVAECSFANSMCGGSGAGIYVTGSLTVTGPGVFEENAASADGAAIYSPLYDHLDATIMPILRVFDMVFGGGMCSNGCDITANRVYVRNSTFSVAMAYGLEFNNSREQRIGLRRRHPSLLRRITDKYIHEL